MVSIAGVSDHVLLEGKPRAIRTFARVHLIVTRFDKRALFFFRSQQTVASPLMDRCETVWISPATERTLIIRVVDWGCVLRILTGVLGRFERAHVF